MAPARSWYGSSDLKRDVLSQIDRHHEDAVLQPLLVEGKSVDLYGWPGVPDFDALRAALAIPRAILYLGMEMSDGFPETETGIRDVIEQERGFLSAVPVGRELSWVADELVASRLVDEHTGVITLVDDRATHVLLEQVADALRCGLPDALPVQDVRAALEQWQAEIPRQWQASKKVEPEVYLHCRALETALAACSVPDDFRAAGRVVSASLHSGGLVLPRNAGSMDGVKAELLELLARA